MGKDLTVYYYPNKQIADQACSSNRLPYDNHKHTPELIEKDRLCQEARSQRVSYSDNDARNLNLDWNDHFSGTYKQLKSTIKELMRVCFNQSSSDDENKDKDEDDNTSDSSSIEEPNYEAIANLSKILKECPWKNGYIVIEND
jgi:hypothetical protein